MEAKLALKRRKDPKAARADQEEFIEIKFEFVD